MGMSGHDHNHENDHEHDHEDLVVLTDEDGVEHEFAVIDVIEVEGKEYAILLPPDDEDDDEAIILRVETDENGEETLVDIEDDAEFEKVAEAWEEILEEEGDEEEDD